MKAKMIIVNQDKIQRWREKLNHEIGLIVQNKSVALYNIGNVDWKHALKIKMYQLNMLERLESSDIFTMKMFLDECKNNLCPKCKRNFPDMDMPCKADDMRWIVAEMLQECMTNG